MTVTPHVAQNTSGRSSAIDARTTRHGGYAVSQRVRKRIGEDEVPWSRPRRVGLHLRCRRLQSGSIAEAHRGKGLMAKLPAFAKAFAGRWPYRRDGRLGQRLP